MTIIISKDGKNARQIKESDFELEKHLQKYLEDNPDIVPIYEIGEDKKLLILAREFNTKHGPIDALGTDKDGEIYIIETKRSKNPDRREIVAQVLDYGASLWHEMNPDKFLLHLENATYEKYQKNLNERLQSEFEIDDEKTLTIVENLKKNLVDGKFQFVVLLDKVESRLKDLIQFINQNSGFNIYPVEFEYYKFDDYQIIIPKLYGAEIKKSMDVKPSGARRKWDENSFFEDAENKLDQKQSQSVRKLYDFSKEHANYISFGTGSENASFGPIFSNISKRSAYTVKSNGALVLNFSWLHDTKEAERRSDEFKEKLSKIKGFNIQQNYRDKFVKIPIEGWTPAADDFISLVKDLITENKIE
jgi:hypothetical protein